MTPNRSSRPPPPDSQLDTGGQSPADGASEAVLARARELDMGGAFEMPPGDPITHFGAGFAKIMASNVFLSGLEPEFVSEHAGYFTAPYEDRKHVVSIDVDRNARTVHVTLDNGVTRTAKIFASQGAVTLPLGADDVFFTPSLVTPELARPETLPWPMGDLTLADDFGLDRDELDRAADLAFAGDSMTAAFLVTYRGEIVAERYSDGIGIHTPLESWSMGKSMTATLLGRLIHQGVYELSQPAPIPEWQSGNDPRAEIRIADILRMSSGLRFRAMQDPDYAPALGYPDHLYVYTGSIDAFEYAATRTQQWPPNQVGLTTASSATNPPKNWVHGRTPPPDRVPASRNYGSAALSAFRKTKGSSGSRPRTRRPSM